jgi:prepilin-type N-terminal cleavage/methylation domain-containing protein
MKRGFTLVEIMIVVAILGLLIAIGVPGFLTARNKSRNSAEKANLKAITDNIASYGINESRDADAIERLWPNATTMADPSSYIRKQLKCPISKVAYSVNTTQNQGSCARHGTEAGIDTLTGQ